MYQVVAHCTRLAPTFEGFDCLCALPTWTPGQFKTSEGTRNTCSDVLTLLIVQKSSCVLYHALICFVLCTELGSRRSLNVATLYDGLHVGASPET